MRNESSTTPHISLSNPAGLYDPRPNGYSHIGEVPANSKLVFIAGQGGETEDGILHTCFVEQVRQAMLNLLTALRGAGAKPSDVVKLTVLIVDHTEEKLAVLATELDHIWGDQLKPTCTLIPVPRLALDGMLFEVEAVAAKPW